MIAKIRCDAGPGAGAGWHDCGVRFGEDVSNPGRSAILDGCGEMAERLKAAVC